MKKLIALLLAMVMVLGLVACTGNTKPEGTTPKAETPTEGAPQSDVTYAIVCKDASNPYMLKMIEGFTDACNKLGVKCVTKSPETTSVDDQITIVNELVAQKVAGIAIAANDAAALEATLKAAREKGVTVVTLDSDTAGSQMFINQAGVEQVAQVLVDSVFDMCEEAGQFAILSASSTATNQNAWIDAMKVILQDEKYANLELVEVVYGDDESQKSTDETQNLMTKYPDLEVICCPTTVGILACAQVIKNADSTIKVAGLGLPSEMKDYVGEDKACPYMYLWNPIDVGSCAAYAIEAISSGSSIEVGAQFTAKNGVTYEVAEGAPAEVQIIVGPPFAFTGENIGEWASVY